MKRTPAGTPSSFGSDITIRVIAPSARLLCEHMRQDPCNEQMAFGLGHWSKTARGSLLIVDDLLLPDAVDLDQQSAGSVSPSREFQALVYEMARQKRAVLVEFHNHPGSCRPRLSGIDERSARENARYMLDRFDDSTTLAMIVGNNDFTTFDGVVFDRRTRQFHEVSRFELLSRPSVCYPIAGPTRDARHEARFDRQARIAHWNQERWESQRIAIAGAGGNGVPVFTALLNTGAGRRGFLAIADDELVEASNLPRLTCAIPEDVGKPKVSPLVEYARRKSPETPVYSFHSRFEHEAVQAVFKMASVLVVCGDNDGLRQTANQCSVRYAIPLIDLGCDIQITRDGMIAGGQVRVVIPGDNACLVCCGGFDAAHASLDNMNEEQRAHYRAAGYVRGAAGDASPTPSIATLNGLTASVALAHLIGLVQGAPFCATDYTHFDLLTLSTITAHSSRRDDCPVCGLHGYLGVGDEGEEPEKGCPGTAGEQIAVPSQTLVRPSGTAL